MPARATRPRHAAADVRARSSSAPTKAPATPETPLDAALDRVWSLLAAAVADRNATLRRLVVVTDGPDARTMVLRGSDRGAGTLRFYSDRRAGKIQVLRDHPRVCIVGYDPVSAIQLRLHGIAAIVTDGAAVDAAWAATPASARRVYMTLDAPGSTLPGPGAGLPDTSDDDHARANCALIAVALDRIEWLHLAAEGHRRAVHNRTDGSWRGSWLVP